jgi:hypothetical protein
MKYNIPEDRLQKDFNKYMIEHFPGNPIFGIE